MENSDAKLQPPQYPYLVSVKSSRKCHHIYHVCIKIGSTSNLIVWDRLVLPSEECRAILELGKRKHDISVWKPIRLTLVSKHVDRFKNGLA